jgi:hypothetical protein
MSFGLTEHFLEKQRLKINKAHLDLLKRGGLTFISVPNKYNPPYRLWKFLAEKAGYWQVEEIPYSRSELTAICQKIGVTHINFFGDSFFCSLNFINPLVIMSKILGKNSLKFKKIKKEKGTPLDQYISYALVLCAQKV